MRFTFVILLFCGLGADAQMIIKAHPNYVPLASANLLLDEYPNARIAFSLRKLSKNYSGNCIRIRRDSTGQAETDIGFDASGIIDTNAIKNFIRNNSAFVTIWYDQTGNSGNHINTVATEQPRIALNGIIEKNNNEVAILFDGSNDVLRFSANTTIFQNVPNGSIYSVYRYVNNPTTGKIIYFASINTNTGNTRFALGGGFTSNRHSIISRRLDSDASSVLSGSTATNTINQILITAQCDWGNGDGFIYLNTSSEATNTSFTTNGNTSNTNSTNSCIGGIKTDLLNVNNINAHIFEIIIYNNITNKSGIETNINSYYGIY
jgi:hypothetical protein